MVAGMLLGIGVALAAPVGLNAQEPGAARRAYFDAVATFFRLPPTEVTILADWEISPDEIPAVLFVARQAGVSPEALVALRRSGHGWAALAQRYRIGAADVYVPVREQAPVGAFERAYARYRETPPGEWRSIRLTDDELVGLVNVRLISQALGMPVEEVIARTGSVDSYVQLFWGLKR